MYYTGLDPRNAKPVYVPKSLHEKEMQRALIQYRNPKNRGLVKEALMLAGREDLIGYGPKCLLRPDGPEKPGQTGKNQGKRKSGPDRKKKTIRNIHKKKQERHST